MPQSGFIVTGTVPVNWTAQTWITPDVSGMNPNNVSGSSVTSA